MRPAERRERLVELMRDLRGARTAREWAYSLTGTVSGLETGRVRADLRQLERDGHVCRHRGPDVEGRPARWEVVR